MRVRNRKTKQSRKNKRKTKKLRGGTVIPFSELGGMWSGLTSSIQSAMSTFSVLPAGYNPPDIPDVSRQFLSPSSNTIQSILK